MANQKIGKKSSGSKLAKAGLPAKAGRRKRPSGTGPHITTAADRKRGRFLALLSAGRLV